MPYLVYNCLCARVGAKLRVFCVQGDSVARDLDSQKNGLNSYGLGDSSEVVEKSSEVVET